MPRVEKFCCGMPLLWVPFWNRLQVSSRWLFALRFHNCHCNCRYTYHIIHLSLLSHSILQHSLLSCFLNHLWTKLGSEGSFVSYLPRSSPLCPGDRIWILEIIPVSWAIGLTFISRFVGFLSRMVALFVSIFSAISRARCLGGSPQLESYLFSVLPWFRHGHSVNVV